MLVQCKSDLWFLNSSLKSWGFSVEVRKRDLVFVVKPLNMPAAFVAATPTRFNIFHALAPTNKTVSAAKIEYQNTSQIKGFELLNLRSFKKFWASHYDVDLSFRQF